MIFGEEIALRYDEWYRTKWGRYADELERRLIEKSLLLEKGDTLLDVGCGTGNYLIALSPDVARAVGVDSSLPMLRVALSKMRRAENISLINGDACDLPLKDGSVDVTLMVTSLEFFPCKERAIEEALRVTRRQIVIGSLNPLSLWWIWTRVKGIFRRTVYDGAELISPFRIRGMLKRADGRLDISMSFALYLPWPGGLSRLIERFLGGTGLPFGGFAVVSASKGAGR